MCKLCDSVVICPDDIDAYKFYCGLHNHMSKIPVQQFIDASYSMYDTVGDFVREFINIDSSFLQYIDNEKFMNDHNLVWVDGFVFSTSV